MHREHAHLADTFQAVRDRTERLCAPLTAEDQQLQAAAYASPTKWHRAHTTWFFDTFVLAPFGGGPTALPGWEVLFNSYYEAVGPRHTRAERGLLSRPTAAQVADWRARVDERVVALLGRVDGEVGAQVRSRVHLGLAHEQQHQELILTDVLAAFACHPGQPQVAPMPPWVPADVAPAGWIEHPGGRARVGLDQGGFDNEGPAHDVWLRPHALATRLVTVGEWAAFAEDGGYDTPSLWLSDGIDLVRAHGWKAPAYSRREGTDVISFGLHGERLAHPDEPVTHLSYYEADALATWMGGRLPTEAESEVGAAGTVDDRADDEVFVPRPLAGDGLVGVYGSVWQWTRSAYSPYPGFRAPTGALGEYNGKFMVNQMVLRGGSALTPPGHSRPTYRNFWPPGTRFQAAGLRLCRDV